MRLVSNAAPSQRPPCLQALNTRRSTAAAAGAHSMLAAHPAELRRHTTLVVETAAERIGDGDASVRAALRELLAGTLLPALGGSALAPFVPLLMAHVCAAMTHLTEPIR